jgi:hypothetical protein
MGSSVAVCGLLGALATCLLIRATSARARIAAAALILGGIGLTALPNLHGPAGLEKLSPAKQDCSITFDVHIEVDPAMTVMASHEMRPASAPR